MNSMIKVHIISLMIFPVFCNSTLTPTTKMNARAFTFTNSDSDSTPIHTDINEDHNIITFFEHCPNQTMTAQYMLQQEIDALQKKLKNQSSNIIANHSYQILKVLLQKWIIEDLETQEMSPSQTCDDFPSIKVTDEKILSIINDILNI